MASPLLGYNTNVRHHGKLFHIQTEDSGIQHGHIFTHLFADGGRIIATKKTTYSQWIGTDKFAATVKKLMQAQHKAMFVALRDGLFDADEAAGARAFASKEISLDDESAPALSSPQRTPSQPAMRAQVAVMIDGAATTPKPTLDDVSAFERAADTFRDTIPGAEPAPVIPPVHQVAPSVPNARASSSGAITSAGAATAATTAAGTTSPGAVARPGSGGYQRPDPNSPGRYQLTQPVARKKSQPAKPKDSLFGQDLVSEKSLDEVIMGYLADDLDRKD